MRRFLSIWLVFIVVAVFAAAILISLPLASHSAEQTAQQDLNALLDAAFALMDSAGQDADAVATVSENNILAKARATARFLTHDDALLQTDALVSLCEMLEVSAIDVTDYAGTVIASSVAGHIGRNLVEESATAWTSQVLEGEQVERTQVDATDNALLWGCVPRTDTEGFVLLQSLDAAILTAWESTNPELVLREFSFINDELELADASGDDAAYIANGRYYVRRTHTLVGQRRGEISLVASRSLGSVYVVRNVVLLVLSIIAIISTLCALVIQLYLLRRSRGRSRIALQQRPQLPMDPSETDLLFDASQSDQRSLPAFLRVPANNAPSNHDAAAATDETDALTTEVEDAQSSPPNWRQRLAALLERVKGQGKIFELVTIEPATEDAPEEEPPAENTPPQDVVHTDTPLPQPPLLETAEPLTPTLTTTSTTATDLHASPRKVGKKTRQAAQNDGVEEVFDQIFD